jgi:tRNA-dihydrouridine synthase
METVAGISSMSEAISNYGITVVFLVVCIFAIGFLFKAMNDQNKETKNYLLDQIKETKSFYMHHLEEQEKNCQEESRIIREQVREVKDELRIYKNEDKIFLQNFVSTLSKDNEKINTSLANAARAIEHLTTELKKH